MEEYKKHLDEYGVDFDEKFLWEYFITPLRGLEKLLGAISRAAPCFIVCKAYGL